MIKPGSKSRHTDDIGVYVDEAIRNPERAEDIKAALRQRLEMPSIHRLRRTAERTESAYADAEEFWDNVPV